jgi:hypothetical protein
LGRNPNSIAASVVAKWEGGLMSEKEAEANAKRLDREMDRSLHPDSATVSRVSVPMAVQRSVFARTTTMNSRATKIVLARHSRGL